LHAGGLHGLILSARDRRHLYHYLGGRDFLSLAALPPAADSPSNDEGVA